MTVPAIVYANILLPGQELAVHTDVPEFRGANRRIVPQWLLVVMRHSELFESWRMRIATAVAYFGDAEGGDRWTVRAADAADAADGPVAEYRTSDLRYSVSWKAYCFADETERDAWATHHDDLTLDHILDTLETDLRSRGHIDGPRPPAPTFGKLLIDTYIRFPTPA